MKREKNMAGMESKKAVEVRSPPPDDVLRKFGATGSPTLLDGGQGQTYRAGDAVLKPVDECDGWISELQATIANGKFPMPRPIKCNDGKWICNGWAAWESIDGRHEPARWQEKIQTCIDFHEAISTLPKPLELEAAKSANPWNIADQVAWGEREITHHPRIGPSIHRLLSILKPLDVSDQLIHGDFQILFVDSGPSVVIDFSPYWRPATFAVGVVIVDALVWGNASISIVDHIKHMTDFDQFLARAELRRVVEIETLHSMYGWDMIDEVDDHSPTIDFICDLCR